MKKMLKIRTTKRDKIFSLFAVTLCLLMGACKKDNSQVVMENALSIQDAKLLYDAQYAAANTGRTGRRSEPLWDSGMKLNRLDTGIVLKFPITQTDNPYLLSTVIFKKGAFNSYQVGITETQVDSNYYNRFKNADINGLVNQTDFSGKIYTKTLANRIQNIRAYAMGNLLYESTIITFKNGIGAGQFGGNGKVMTASNGGGSYEVVNYNIQLRSVPMNMLICTRSVSFTIYPGSSPMYAEVLSKVKQTCFTTQVTNSPDVAYQIFIELWGIAQNLAAQNNPNEEDEPSSGGGIGGSSSTTTAPRASDLATAIVVDNGKPKIADIKKYTDCFNDGKTAQSYTMTIYADQPVAGQSDWFKIVVPTGGVNTNQFNVPTGVVFQRVNGDNFDVGHTFVTFEKNNTDGTNVRQTLGFYPSTNPLVSKGSMEDNSGHSADVSYTINVSKAQFDAGLQKLESDFNSKNYILFNNGLLNEYNCTDAAISWMNAAGASFGNSSSGLFNNTPGTFGQVLRNIQGANKNPTTGISGKGPCN